MPWMTAAAIGGGSVLNYFGGQQAQGAANAMSQQELQLQQQQFTLNDPFAAGGNRGQYVPQLNQLMQGGYSGLQNDPQFKALQGIGEQGVQRTMAAQGQGLSTNDQLNINQADTGLAMSYFDQQYNRLSTLSGANQGAAPAPTTGISPVQAGQMAMAPYQMMGQAFGGIAAGLKGIYGNSGGTASAGGGGGGVTPGSGVSGMGSGGGW